MGTEPSRLGKNIKDLRKAHGETQQELGRFLNVEYNTISMYESGKRQPDLDTLQKIAARYGRPLDEFVRADFSSLDLTMAALTWENVVSSFDIMFPTVCSDKALEDASFTEGYNITNRISTEIKQGGTVTRSLFERAMDAYEKSFDESEIEESIVNILWLIYVLYALLPDEQSIKMGEAVLYGKASRGNFIKSYLLNKNIPDTINEANKQSYSRDMNGCIVECMRILKSSSEYANLADYYLALRYVIGMVDTDFGQNLNKAIGMEMMLSFLSLGNPYAFSFVENSLKM